ncbi:MAG: glutathione peroxidase [Pseudoclavibacter sp.]
MSTIHDFNAELLDGTPVDLGDYRGQVLLVVNTASKCGFAPQFSGLDELFRKYQDRGFAVLGFPSNQFLQEPGSSKQIGEVCSLKFNVSFPMFAKVDVNGHDSHPVWQFLKQERSGMLSSAIKWNFTKFLVGRDGHVVRRYPPNAEPETLRHDIEEALKAPAESTTA